MVLSAFVPKTFRLSMEKNIVYAQMSIKNVYAFLGAFVLLSLILSIIVSFIVFQYAFSYIDYYAWILFIGLVPSLFFGVLFTVRAILALIAGRAAEQVDKALPDMLLLMAANLRAGMVPENSFIESMRPQFGKLNNLLKEAAIDVQSGNNFRSALLNMSEKTSSRFFKETIKIISDAIRSGGELHLTLENLADNLLQSEALRRSMKAQVRSYSLFIFIASVFAAPLLYGVASLLIGILDKVASTIGTRTVTTPSVGLGAFSSFTLVPVPVNLVLLVAIIDVVITTSASALVGGVLNTGNAKDGITTLPIYLLLGLGIFFAVRIFLSGLFSSIMVGAI